MTEQTKKGRGFAGMSPEKRREVAKLGGKAIHAKGVAHRFTPEQAREAGLKGAAARKAKREEPEVCQPAEPEGA
jgi:uncharacterized protein